jgi:hypothetical protein
MAEFCMHLSALACSRYPSEFPAFPYSAETAASKRWLEAPSVRAEGMSRDVSYFVSRQFVGNQQHVGHGLDSGPDFISLNETIYFSPETAD